MADVTAFLSNPNANCSQLDLYRDHSRPILPYPIILGHLAAENPLWMGFVEEKRPFSSVDRWLLPPDELPRTVLCFIKDKAQNSA